QVPEPAPPLASLGLTVPRKLASLVDRWLAKEPGHRPASAQALAEQLGVALEQRRELPAALRAFVKRSARLNGGGTLISGFLLLPLAILATVLSGKPAAGFMTITLAAMTAAFGYFVRAARELLLLGFAHRDLGQAFRAEVDQTRE